MGKAPRIIAAVVATSLAGTQVSFAGGLQPSQQAAAAVVAVPEPAYWPTSGWRETLPEDQGLDSAKLAQAVETIRKKGWSVHSLLVIRNGFVVLDASFFPYSSSPHDVASVTKSVTATLVGVAIEQKKIRSLADPLLSFLPDRTPANLDTRKSRITIGDLLSMRSGLDCDYKDGERTLKQMFASSDWVQFVLDRPMKQAPGEEFVYCSPGMHLLSAVLSRATGEATQAFAQHQLFGPLGIKDVIWPADPTGIARGWGDIHLLPRDLAKVGFLYLHDGVWDGTRILPPDFVAMSTTPITKTPFGDDYGYGWWISPTQHQNEFFAIGRGGQRLTVLRKLNAIVVVTGGGGFDPGEINGMLAAAARSSGRLPPNPTGVERLKQVIAAVAVASSPARRLPQLPQSLRQISAKVYELCPNSAGLDRFSVTLDSQQPVVSLWLSDGRTERHPAGVGIPVVSPGGKFGLPVAMQSEWAESGQLSIEYDSVANINAYRLILKRGSDSDEIQVQQRGDNKEVPLQIRGNAACASAHTGAA